MDLDYEVEEQGGKATLRLSCPNDGKGLYKAYVLGPSGRCLLGTMTPDRTRLCLTKTLGVDALRQRGCWPVRGVERELSFPFQPPGAPLPGWCPPPQGLPWAEDALRNAFERTRCPLYRAEPGGGFTLAYPYAPERPFPLPALFCLARTACLQGRVYLLFSFDSAGRPTLPHSGPPGGQY